MSKKDSNPGLLLVVNPQWETRGLALGQSGDRKDDVALLSSVRI